MGAAELRDRVVSVLCEDTLVEPLGTGEAADDLSASAADLEFVSVAKIAGSGSWTPVNTGTPTDLVIEDPANGIDIPAGEQITVEITVRLQDTATNVPGLEFTNTASWTYNQLDDDDPSELPGQPGSSPPMTIVGPELVFAKTGPATMNLGETGSFTLDVTMYTCGVEPCYYGVALFAW